MYKQPDIALVLDVTGCTSPEPVLSLRRALGRLENGRVIEVHADDPATIHDIPAYCTQRGQSLLTASDQDGLIIFRIRKRHMTLEIAETANDHASLTADETGDPAGSESD